MTEEEFKNLHLCSFEPDQRTVEIEDRLIDYYKRSENMDNRAAYKLWKEFKEWAKTNNYTTKEVNQAKRRCNNFVSTEDKKF